MVYELGLICIMWLVFFNLHAFTLKTAVFSYLYRLLLSNHVSLIKKRNHTYAIHHFKRAGLQRRASEAAKQQRNTAKLLKLYGNEFWNGSRGREAMERLVFQGLRDRNESWMQSATGSSPFVCFVYRRLPLSTVEWKAGLLRGETGPAPASLLGCVVFRGCGVVDLIWDSQFSHSWRLSQSQVFSFFLKYLPQTFFVFFFSFCLAQACSLL